MNNKYQSIWPHCNGFDKFHYKNNKFYGIYQSFKKNETRHYIEQLKDSIRNGFKINFSYEN